MRSSAARLAAVLAILSLSAAAGARAESASPQAKPEAQEKAEPTSPAEIRAELYDRLAAAKDEDETQGIIRLLFASYAESGSDTGDLLLTRARKAMSAKDFGAAGEILDAAIAIFPDWAEGFNARATLRFLDDVYEHILAIAPHWKSAEEAADKLRAKVKGQEL